MRSFILHALLIGSFDLEYLTGLEGSGDRQLRV